MFRLLARLLLRGVLRLVLPCCTNSSLQSPGSVTMGSLLPVMLRVRERCRMRTTLDSGTNGFNLQNSCLVSAWTVYSQTSGLQESIPSFEWAPTERLCCVRAQYEVGKSVATKRLDPIPCTQGSAQVTTMELVLTTHARFITLSLRIMMKLCAKAAHGFSLSLVSR
jgi:hypothetical protein